MVGSPADALKGSLGHRLESAVRRRQRMASQTVTAVLAPMLAAVLSLTAFAAATPAAAQQAPFPSQPIRIILTNAPGIPNDTLARGKLEHLGRVFGQKVIIDNRIGADGIIGADACAKSAPDGHTICSST